MHLNRRLAIAAILLMFPFVFIFLFSICHPDTTRYR